MTHPATWSDYRNPRGTLDHARIAMREQMGVSEPNFGPLTAPMLLPSGTQVPSGALQPRTEPEIGLRLARELAGPCSAEQALAACSAAVACLEIVDSIWAGYRFRLPDNTADLSSAAWVVTGGLTAAPYLSGHTVTAVFTPPAGSAVTVTVNGRP